jgi:Fe-S-cluster containining protein
VSPRSIVRPVVRSFSSRETLAAAAHVRAGGHAVIWEGRSRARLLLPVPKEHDPMDLAFFSILDLGKSRFEIARRGVTKGLATLRVPHDCHDIVRRRAERDRIHPGSMRTLELDCGVCAACCRANRVVLEDEDVQRFAQAKRGYLAKMPYARRSDGKLVLRLTKGGACVHLERDKRCGIYEIRPEMCRVFPLGSECCLSARAEELNQHDGAPPKERSSSPP